MDPESQETSGNLEPGPHPAAHSLRASISSDVTENPHCLAYLGWEEYTGPEMVRDLGGIAQQGPPTPIFPRKPKPRGAGEAGTAGALGPQDSLAGAHGALQSSQGPIGWALKGAGRTGGAREDRFSNSVAEASLGAATPLSADRGHGGGPSQRLSSLYCPELSGRVEASFSAFTTAV